MRESSCKKTELEFGRVSKPKYLLRPCLTALQFLTFQQNCPLSVPPYGLLAITALRELHIDEVQQHCFGPFWASLVPLLRFIR